MDGPKKFKNRCTRWRSSSIHQVALLTNSDDDEGGSSVENPNGVDAKDSSVEEEREREGEGDADERPDGQPDGEGGKHKDEQKDESDGEAGKTEVVVEGLGDLVVKQLVASVQYRQIAASHKLDKHLFPSYNTVLMLCTS